MLSFTKNNNVLTDENLAECLMLQKTCIMKVAEEKGNVQVTVEGTQKTFTTNDRVEKVELFESIRSTRINVMKYTRRK